MCGCWERQNESTAIFFHLKQKKYKYSWHEIALRDLFVNQCISMYFIRQREHRASAQETLDIRVHFLSYVIYFSGRNS